MRNYILLSLVVTSLVALTSAWSRKPDLRIQPVIVTPQNNTSSELPESKSEKRIKEFGEIEHIPPREKKKKWCDHARELARVNTLFEAAFHNNMAAVSTTLSMFLSPFAVSTGLAMVYAGARHMTRYQMKKTLKFDVLPSNCHVHEGFRRILYQFTEPKHNHVVKVSVRAFIERSYTMLPAFVNLIRKDYPVGLQRLPFQSSPAQSLATINNWVSTASDGRIPWVINSRVTSATKLLLLNVNFFKGRWQHEFPPWRTQRQRFYKSVTKHVDMMRTSINSPYLRYAHLRSLRARVVELPYLNQHSRVSMFIVLPYWGRRLVDLEQAFDWNPLSMRLRLFRMDVALPRFSVRHRVGLATYLKKMNMTDLFNSTTADLSGIDGQRDLSVDTILHEAVINVTETGTESGAANTLSKARGAHSFAPGFKFIVNRPFLFFIYDHGTNTLLFTGRFLKSYDSSTD